MLHKWALFERDLEHSHLLDQELRRFSFANGAVLAAPPNREKPHIELCQWVNCMCCAGAGRVPARPFSVGNKPLLAVATRPAQWQTRGTDCERTMLKQDLLARGMCSQRGLPTVRPHLQHCCAPLAKARLRQNIMS